MGIVGVGVDPGTAGAIAIIERSEGRSRILAMHSLVSVTEGKKTWLHGRSLIRVLQEWNIFWAPVLVTVEDVASMPNQGIASALKFGVSIGGIMMAVEIGFPEARISLIKPTDWKKIFGVTDSKATDSQRKDIARRKATDIFGATAGATYWPLVKDADKAEAALIAEAGLIKLGSV